MAFQSRQQSHFSQQIITTTNRQLVSSDQAAPRFNNPVQMGRANPFATTMENPWLGLNHMFLGSNNMVIQQHTTSMTAAAAPGGLRKRSRDITENHQFNQLNVIQSTNNLSVPACAPQNIRADMASLMETDFMLSQYSKRVKMEIDAKQKEEMNCMLERVRAPIMRKLKEKDEQILNMGKLNMALQEKVKYLYEENQMWKDVAITSQASATSLLNNLDNLKAEFSKLRGLMPPAGVVALPDEELESYCGSNVSEKNKQRNAQGCMLLAMTDGGENAAEKVQNLGETGESSGENKMCKICGVMESSVLAVPCRHLCFCNACGFKLHPADCPVCGSTMTATMHVSLLT